MNRKERKAMSEAVRGYCMAVGKASEEFSDYLDDLISHEEEKLNRIPENLQDSSQADNITDAIEQMEEMQEALENVQETCDELMNGAGLVEPA